MTAFYYSTNQRLFHIFLIFFSASLGSETPRKYFIFIFGNFQENLKSRSFEITSVHLYFPHWQRQHLIHKCKCPSNISQLVRTSFYPRILILQWLRRPIPTPLACSNVCQFWLHLLNSTAQKLYHFQL